MRLSIIIPAYNEAARLGDTLRAARIFFGQAPYECEVIVVDDGSDDGTSDIATAHSEGVPPVRLVRNPTNRGKGYAVRKGFQSSRGEYVLVSDADLSTPLEEIQKLWIPIEHGYDIAIASRALPDSSIEVRQPWYRENMGRIFNVFVRFLVLRGIHDTQCGFKLFTRRAALAISQRMTIDRFAFDVEMLFLARAMGYRITEIPVVWRNSAATTVHPVWDAIDMLHALPMIRWNYISGRYDNDAGSSDSTRPA